MMPVKIVSPDVITKVETKDRSLLLFTVQFRIDPGLEIQFLAKEDKNHDFCGIKVEGTRKALNKTYRLKQEVIHGVFNPRLTIEPNKPQCWRMQIQPLKQPLVIMKKKNKYVCKHVFQEFNVLAKFTHVMVDVQLQPLAMSFTVHGTFRSAKNAPVKKLEDSVQCSDAFVTALHNLMGN